MEIDPTQFLAQNHYDDNEDNDDEQMSQQPDMSMDDSGRPLMSTLGLHHINAANQFGVSYGCWWTELLIDCFPLL